MNVITASAPKKPQPRRHHYVPRMLLANFSVERKAGKFQTNVFDKQSDKTFKTAIENTMVEGDFNTVDFDGLRIEAEPFFTEVEAAAAPAIKKLIATENLGAADAADWLALSNFVAVQRVRGTNVRQQLIDFEDQLRKRLGPDAKELLDGMGGEEGAKLAALGISVDAVNEFSQHVGRLTPLLIKAEPGHEFILGDAAVAMFNHRQFGPYGNIGFAVPGIEIYLPLSPSLLLAFWCPSILDEMKNELNTARQNLIVKIQQFGLNNPIVEKIRQQTVIAAESVSPLLNAAANGTTFAATEENITWFNSLQIRDSERYVVSLGGEFELALRMTKDNPRTRLGPRMQMS